MRDPSQEAGEKAVSEVIAMLGISGVPADAVPLIAEAVVGLVEVLGTAAAKKAALAGEAAAAKILTSDDAEKAASERT